MGTESIPKLLVQFSIPVMIGMVVAGLYNVINRIFIGKTSASPSMSLAAIAVGMPIMLVTMAFGMLIGFGGAAAISLYLGQKDKEKAEQVLGNGYSLAIIIGLILTVFGMVFLDPLLIALGASRELLPYAREYNGIILLGSIASTIGFGLNNYIRAEGNPRIAGMNMVISSVLNIIADYILIVLLHMGLKGAAIGTVFAQLFTTAAVFFYFTSSKSHIKFHLRNLIIRLEIAKKIVSIGSSAFVQQIGACFVQVAFNNQLRRYGGETAIAAWGLIQTIVLFFLFPIFGINAGAQPLVGYNYGAKNFDRVKSAAKAAILGATAFTTGAFFLVQLFPYAVIGLFIGHDQKLLDLAAYGLRVFCIFMPVLGFQIIASGYFTSVGKPVHSVMLSLTRQVIFLFPLVWIMPRFLKLNGIFCAVPIADFLGMIVVSAFFVREFASLKRKHSEIVASKTEEETEAVLSV
jgi:putative MATE family efflux protein